MPEATVLTAVRNGVRYLPETIDSIRNQTFEDWEYIIVDDNSTDKTVEMVKGYQDQDKRIKLIQISENIGPYAAANIGLKQANGKYIVRTDADDISLPDRINKQVEFLKSISSIKACASYAMRMDENSNLLEDKLVKSTLNPGSIKWYLFLRCPLVHSTACIEKQVLEEMGGYNPAFAAQDYRMWCYLARRGFVAQIPEILVYFRLTSTGISLSQTNSQLKFGYEVAQDHILKVTGERWPMQTVAALNAIGLVRRDFPVSKSLKASRLWDRCWLADKTLTNEEISELTSLSKFLRKTFLRRNRRKQPLSIVLNSRDYFFPSPRSKFKTSVPQIQPY
jgi:glycosyltransferase involved in cell wall biosynthesis